MRKAYLKDDGFPTLRRTLENETRRARVSARATHSSWFARVFVMTLILARPTAAQTAPNADIPIYSIAQPDWPLWQLPSMKSAHRGALAQSERIRLFATAEGPDCRNPWWQVGADAWLCPDAATLTQALGSESAPGPPITGRLRPQCGQTGCAWISTSRRRGRWITEWRIASGIHAWNYPSIPSGRLNSAPYHA